MLTQQITYQAAHDSLTGLSNRREFSRQTARITDKGPHALLYMDIDHFKIVNDRCGHTAGDNLLAQVADTIKAQCKEKDLLARLGGDEFVLLSWKCDREEAVDLAERLRKAVKGINFVWQERRYAITISVGIACFEDVKCLPFEHILGLADSACFLAKEKGRNRVQLSTMADEEVVHQQRDMDNVTRLKQALEDGRIELHIQKIIAFGSTINLPPFYEVLARLRDLDGTLIQPAAFVSAAERYGVIEELDNYIVRKAFESLHSLSGDKPQPTLFINISSITLSSSGFLVRIKDLLLCFAAVSPAQICFEITETAAVANVRKTADAMLHLSKLGFRFALDDFGSGMASFSYLQQLPVQFIKIDGEFVRSILKDETNAIIVESVIKVARSMNVQSIAEYVENEEILLRLKRIGADYGQGFVLHMPEPICNII